MPRFSWQCWLARRSNGASRRPPRKARFQPRVEQLEDRALPSLFNAPTAIAFGGATGLAKGDFNGDGKLDLAAASYRSLGVFLGNGDGSFKSPTTYGFIDRADAVAVGDFNGDGKLDLAVTTFRVNILLGNGNGTFQPAVSYDAGAGVADVAVGDFNGDAKQDLVVANAGFDGSTVTVLLANGDGTFGPQTAYAVGTSTFAVAVGDFNGDGKLDLAAANYGSVGSTLGSVSVLLGNGNGNFATQTTYASVVRPRALAVGDFNGDAKQDLAAVGISDASVSVLLGNGNGSFAPHTTFAAGDGATSMAIGDFNGDAKLDLALGNAVLWGNGDGAFAPPISLNIGLRVQSGSVNVVVVGDFNNDGKQDLVVAASFASDSLSLLLGNGNGTFPTITTLDTKTVQAGRTVGVAAGDFNADGTLDLAAANYHAQNVGIFLNKGNAGFAAQATYAVSTTPRAIVTGDFNGDGKLDLATANVGSRDVSILLGNGNGTFAPQIKYAVGNAPVSLAVGDFDGNGKLDLAVANAGDDTVSVLLGIGNGSFTPEVTFAAGSNPFGVAVGDFNGDGNQDLAVADRKTNTVSILRGNGNGTFGTPSPFAVGESPQALLVGDFSGDGKQDLAVVNSSSSSVSILPGNGNGSFAPQSTYAAGAAPQTLAAGDFNGDGKLDLVVANTGDIVSVLLGNGNGSFAPSLAFTAANLPWGITVADVNGDGAPDVITANYNSNNLAILLNAEGTTTTLTSSPNPAKPGQTVTLRATVKALSALNGTPTGSVTFQNAGVTLGTVPLSNGVATLTTTLGATVGLLSAVYNANPPFFGSTGTTGPAQITGFSPGSGLVGSQVAITGTNFSSASTVAFNGVASNFVVISPTFITATVPSGATDGSITVTTPYGSASTAASFTVTTPAARIVVTGADAGGGPQVRVYEAETNKLVNAFFAYDANFTGGVRVAVGNVNGDAVPDIVTAPGPGGGPDIHVYDGATGQLIRQFVAYDPNFTGGVYVAAGDVNGDGFADIICGADAGGGPNVTVFSGKDGSRLLSFFPYDPAFTGGVRVAAGDTNGDGKAEIITGAGRGGGPNVTVYQFVNGQAQMLQSYFAYDPRFTAGVYVATGDVNDDGRADVVVGPGAGGGPNVAVFNGADGALFSSFFAFDAAFTGGVRVAAIDRTGTGRASVIAVPGPGGGPQVRALDGLSGALLDSFFAYDPAFTGGLFVAARG